MRRGSAEQLLGQAPERTGTRRFRGGQRPAGPKRRKALLDLAVGGEAAGFALGEDRAAVDNDVELTHLPDFDFGLLAEAGLQGGGQTGRARLVASLLAVKNLDGHAVEPSLSPGMAQTRRRPFAPALVGFDAGCWKHR